MADETAEPAKWVVGPPAPWTFTLLARLLELATFVLTAFWVFNNLGGVGFAPKVVFGPKPGVTANDTGPIFNWHPLLMSLAFPRKILHASLHTAAIVCIILAIVAAFQSHTQKLPTPIPNLYSPHSYLGMLTFVLSLLQYLVGLGVYLNPKVSKPQRLALGPLHTYLGRATFVLGLATMAVGIQEKTTFVQTGMKLQGSALFRSYLRIPATLQLLLALLGLLVLYHHAPPASSRRPDASSSGLLEDALRSDELPASA